MSDRCGHQCSRRRHPPLTLGTSRLRCIAGGELAPVRLPAASYARRHSNGLHSALAKRNARNDGANLNWRALRQLGRQSARRPAGVAHGGSLSNSTHMWVGSRRLSAPHRCRAAARSCALVLGPWPSIERRRSHTAAAHDIQSRGARTNARVLQDANALRCKEDRSIVRIRRSIMARVLFLVRGSRSAIAIRSEHRIVLPTLDAVLACVVRAPCPHNPNAIGCRSVRSPPPRPAARPAPIHAPIHAPIRHPMSSEIRDRRSDRIGRGRTRSDMYAFRLSDY